ncbi:sigma-70 family RNA polymerase sigma factor [Luteolibacter marinus]|uniref:sigma-70 family RNA polymerase sigma factor n=1 Tax=Luteolibacter marinus TaxID=2776705 RepID=UPI001868491D|nr:sigma-70 family RNA polymerase sigma factor [Luteolibacter marinus]
MNQLDVEYLQLVTRYQPALFGYIRSIAPGANADDILQETNLVLWEKASTFEPGTNFKAFAFRIAHFKTLEALRSSKRHSWLQFDSDLLDSIADQQLGQAEAAHDDGGMSRQTALGNCLGKLSEDDRSLVHCRYTRQQSIREISRSSGRTEGALQQVFFRIRNALRTCVERELSLNRSEA